MYKIIKNVILTCFFIFFLTINVLSDNTKEYVILQGFHWESHNSKCWWNIISSKANDISNSKIDAVWFPPSGAAISDQGYLPSKYYDQNSKYGNIDQLKNAISTLHSQNIKVIADIVINHRVGTSNWADFTEPEWGADSVCSDDEWVFAKGNPDTGSHYHAARDIDHTKEYVQDSLIQWLKWMKSDIGYDGFRYDFVKGFDGYYVEKYNKASKPIFSVGEYWDNLDLNDPNKNRQQLCDWIDSANGSSLVFDFTTKGILQQAVQYNEYWRLKDSQDKPSGLIGWWPEKACTFIDNHDTGPSTGANVGQNHWPFPSDKVMLGYAYILTHPGVPCIYWVHFYDWNIHDKIKKLIKIRKDNNIHSTSKVNIICADNSKYAAIIDDKVAIKIGHGNWEPGNGWIFKTSGKDYAVWCK